MKEDDLDAYFKEIEPELMASPADLVGRAPLDPHDIRPIPHLKLQRPIVKGTKHKLVDRKILEIQTGIEQYIEPIALILHSPDKVIEYAKSKWKQLMHIKYYNPERDGEHYLYFVWKEKKLEGDQEDTLDQCRIRIFQYQKDPHYLYRKKLGLLAACCLLWAHKVHGHDYNDIRRIGIGQAETRQKEILGEGYTPHLYNQYMDCVQEILKIKLDEERFRNKFNPAFWLQPIYQEIELPYTTPEFLQIAHLAARLLRLYSYHRHAKLHPSGEKAHFNAVVALLLATKQLHPEFAIKPYREKTPYAARIFQEKMNEMRLLMPKVIILP